jgi:hypothetical protein
MSRWHWADFYAKWVSIPMYSGAEEVLERLFPDAEEGVLYKVFLEAKRI